MTADSPPPSDDAAAAPFADGTAAPVGATREDRLAVEGLERSDEAAEVLGGRIASPSTGGGNLVLPRGDPALHPGRGSCALMKKRTTPIIRIRPAGGVYIALSIALGVVSVNSGNNLLYLVTALLLGYMLASGIAGRHNVMSAEAWAELPDEIYAGRAFPLVVKVRNRRHFASLHLIEVAE